MYVKKVKESLLTKDAVTNMHRKDCIPNTVMRVGKKTIW